MIDSLKKHLDIIGIVLLCAIIWFVAPLISISGEYPFEGIQARLSLTLGACVIYLGYKLYRSSRKKSKNTKFVDRLSSAESNDAVHSRAEKDIISKKFTDACEALKTKKLGENKLLVDLPWYLMMGFPGSGKTSCLAKSNLQMPFDKNINRYADENESGGTRNLVFNITNDAVLVDMAGRYTSQDSRHSSDKSGWSYILASLSSFRKPLALNGVVVTISALDIQTGDISSLENQTMIIRNRLSEMTGLLKQKIPIYFIVTKMDLVLGFTEYFSHLSDREKAAPFGILIDGDYSKNRPVEQDLNQIKSKLQKISDTIQDNVIGRIAQEATQNQNANIMSFPVQFAKFQHNLTVFFELFFEQNVSDKGALCRGVFFVSNIQKGTPLDNIYHSLNKYMEDEKGLEKFKIRAKTGYFIKSLLKNTVIPEQNMVRSFSLVDRTQKFAYRGSTILAAAAGILLAVGLLFLGSSEISAIDSVNRESDSYAALVSESNANHIEQTTAVLTGLMKTQSQTHSDFPTYNHLAGLSQEEKISDQLNASYTEVLYRVFQRNVINYVEQHLNAAIQANDGPTTYTALKTYLMLTAESQRIIPADVIAFFDSTLSKSHLTVTQPDLPRQVIVHLEKLLTPYNTTSAADPALIQRARRTLRNMSKEQRTYLAFVAKYEESQDNAITIDSGDYSLNPIRLKANQQDSTTFHIPGIYTYKGYHEQFLPFIKKSVTTGEDWVYGTVAKTGKRQEDLNKKTIKLLKHRYYRAYLRYWLKVLNRIEFKVDNIRDLADVDQFFYRDSFFVKVMDAAYRNAILSVPNHIHKMVMQPVAEGMPNPIKRFYSEGTFKSLTPIEKKFFPLIKFYANSKRATRYVKLEQAMKGFSERALAIQSSPNGNEQALKELHLLVNNKSKTLSAFNNTRWKNTVGISAVVSNVKSYGFNLYSSMAEEHLREIWQESYDTCIDAISSKYPFASRSAESVDLELFSTYFAPGGIVDKYLDKHIDPLVARRKGSMRWKAKFGFSKGIFNDIALFKRLQKTYFKARKKTLNVSFKLKPTYLSHLAVGVYVDLGGDVLAYEHGPARLSAFQWPSPSGGDFASIRFRPLSGNDDFEFSIENDPWAPIKILAKYLRRSNGSRTYSIAPRIKNMDAALSLVAGSRWNPWNLKGLGRFQCLKL